MNVKIYREPCWLLEAAELVYSLVNEIPPEKMTSKGPYCIPAEEAARIRDVACAQIDPEDKRLKFYFQGFPLEGNFDRLSCPGICVLHQELELRHSDPTDAVEAMKQSWRSDLENGYFISGMGLFSLDMDKGKEGDFLSLTESVENLPIPKLYQMRLLEVYATYEQHLQRIYELLTPVIQTLPALLEPWVRRASPLMDQWETFFQTTTPEAFLQKRAGSEMEEYDLLEVAFGYFFSKWCPSRVFGEKRIVRCMMSVQAMPSLDPAASAHPGEEELAALRLVANPTRLEMLHTMRSKGMGVQELASRLSLNVGSVSRDISNMKNARLLLVDYKQDRGCYRTNYAEIERIARHVLDYLREE